MKYCLLFSAFIFFGCRQSGRDKKISDLLQLSVVSDSLQQYRESVDIYTDILQLDSTKITALTNRGRALIWMGQLKKGFADYDKAVFLYPSAQTYFRRGMAYLQVNEYHKVVPDLHACIALNPQFAEAYYYLGLVKVRQNDLDSARYFCTKADGIGYRKEYNLSVWYEIFMKQGDYESAVAEMTKAIAFYPQTASWYNNRGFAHNRLQHYEAALEDCDIAIVLDPKFGFSYNNKGYALLHLHEVDSALIYVNRSMKLIAKNPFAYQYRGEIYLALKNKASACQDFDKALQLSKDSIVTKDVLELRNKYCQ